MSHLRSITTIQLDDSALTRFGYENDPAMRVDGFFPLSVANGARNTAAVYFELEPGKWLGTHTDSAEEVLVLLSGTAEIVVGQARKFVSGNTMALVPAMEPHSVRNCGEDKVRVIGFFSTNTVMSTFDEPLVPIGKAPPMEESVRTLVTPPPFQLEEPVAMTGE